MSDFIRYFIKEMAKEAIELMKYSEICSRGLRGG